MSTKTPVVVLSPHYDDAILSCGGMLAHLSRRDLRCSVITVFGGPPTGSQVTPLMRNYVAEDLRCPKSKVDMHACKRLVECRKYENVRACNSLHVGFSDMPFTDAIYRHNMGTPLYKTEKHLFSAIHPFDASLSKRIAGVLKRKVSRSDIVLAPLSAGEHVDHKIVKDVGDILLARNYNVLFYADFPYNANIPPPPKSGNAVVDISEHIDSKIQAIAHYDSQIEGIFRSNTDMKQALIKNSEEYLVGTEKVLAEFMGLYF